MSPVGAWSVERHGRIPSTNDRAKELARSGSPSRSVVVAAEQTAGRGRGDHSWSSPPGGLYASVVLRDLPAAVVPLVALVGGLALRGAAAARFPDLRLWLKWPNDLLAAPRGAAAPVGKAGGVLVEASGTGRGIDWVVVGFGLNVAVDVSRLGGLDPPAVSLVGLSDRRAGPDDLLHDLLDALDGALRRYGDAGRLVADVDAVLAYRGERVVLTPHGGGVPFEGVLVGLGPDGGLRLEEGGGVVRRVAAWDAASLRPRR